MLLGDPFSEPRVCVWVATHTLPVRSSKMSPTGTSVNEFVLALESSEDVEEASDHPDYVRYGSNGYQMTHSHFVFGNHDWSSKNALANN
jgi:hypothetical protein